MKGIIMAGGKGTRLRPLTCDLPKPLVPVANRPVMAYGLELLQRHGITEVGVTLHYLSEKVQEYFLNQGFEGRLAFFREEKSLGTAGSVKNAASFLDDTFVVLSGDALTDLDLTAAIAFHRERGALATLVLTRVECPLEYGVVLMEEDGRIRCFLEKPGWSEVFSDTVNTGIYILEPEILDYVPAGEEFDFSKDLFPLLLREGKPLYGVVLEGYWCDIGNLEAYRQAQEDVLAGRVKLSLPGQEIAPGIRVEEGVEIDPTARIEGPVLIGAGSRVGPGVHVGPYTVLGRECCLQEGASLKRSILWDRCFVGRGASLRGVVLGHQVQVHAGVSAYEGVVVGDRSVLQEGSELEPGVKLWPHKVVEKGAKVKDSLVWGYGYRRYLFGAEGVLGLANIELTPESVARLGSAFGACLGKGSAVVVTSDSYPVSLMLKKALIAGLQGVGLRVKDAGEGVTPMTRFAVRHYDLAGGVHIKVTSQNPDKVRLVFLEATGGNLSRSTERKVEEFFYREDFARETPTGIFPVDFLEEVFSAYLEHLSRLCSPRLSGLRLALLYEPLNLARFVRGLAERTGITWLEFDAAYSSSHPRPWSFYQQRLPDLCRMVVENGADGGAVLDANADHLVLIDERGRIIQDDLFTALLALVTLKQQKGPVVVPVTAPRAVEELASKYRAKVVRTKASRRELWREAWQHAAEHALLYFDALAAILRIFSFVAENRTTLAKLADEIPSYFLVRRDVPVAWKAKGRVIRRLAEEHRGKQVEFIDGVKVYHPEGWTLILPDPEEPVCRVFSEGASMEIAESLTDFYSERIKELTED
ncbi:nucleotidyltransferase [Ammonifex thiophilus]|uniref:Nucleotidyltransferase n=1 Tax=Ammonifex thiophilus TaxID=444093 RepID=A0A3D8P5E0_9THEO|nr:sugar phosphate nucleotidyltransferase [Ammonifex thiophilus]RDV83442.1 nucleotidyltransferase [Ammonifex thiophilus]